MVIPTVHFHSDYSRIPLRIAKGHFATNHSHINYYIDMTYTKHRLAEARQAAEELVIQMDRSTIIDTILCLDGTEVLGACLAEAITAAGIRTTNEHNTMYIVTPEYTSAGQMIFRENTAHLIRNRRVLVLAASVTTGGTVQSAIQTIHYYGGACLGACSIFSCLEECEGIPIKSIFRSSQLENYMCLPAGQCPLCKSGVKLDALVNSHGISSF